MNLVTNISLTLYIQGLQLLCHHTEVTGDNSKSEENIATSSFHVEDNEMLIGEKKRREGERERELSDGSSFAVLQGQDLSRILNEKQYKQRSRHLSW